VSKDGKFTVQSDMVWLDNGTTTVKNVSLVSLFHEWQRPGVAGQYGPYNTRGNP